MSESDREVIVVLHFKYSKDTKRTFVFSELDEQGEDAMENGNHMVGSLYVQKTFFSDGKAPNEIFVTISTEAPEVEA